MTVKKWFKGLRHPDSVGQAEYRVIYELIEGVVNCNDDEKEHRELVVAILDEIKGIAGWMKRDMKGK